MSARKPVYLFLIKAVKNSKWILFEKYNKLYKRDDRELN